MAVTPGGSAGPSPRRRGSLGQRNRGGLRAGSIPAQAGEPSGTPTRFRLSGVHPRAGGGARSHRWNTGPRGGPSPRRRGSHDKSGDAVGYHGVHPRAGGGAATPARLARFIWGPSPRRRGSHVWHRRSGKDEGSIPAQAGEPYKARPTHGPRRVHPRAGGGAGGSLVGAQSGRGPSPRRRGSHAGRPGEIGHLGSIPAQAGEPLG